MKRKKFNYKTFLAIFLILISITILSVDTMRAKYTKTLVVTDDLNLTIGEYKLTLDANGGLINNQSVIESTFSSGDVYGELPVPTKEGFIFNGWFTKPGSNNTDGTKVEKDSIIGNNDITLYAHWGFTWTVNYDANGGEGSMKSTIHGWDSGIKLRKNLFIKNNYSFGGWYLSREENGKVTWAYTNQNDRMANLDDWYEEDKQPKGYTKYVLLDEEILEECTNIENDNLTAHAIWISEKNYFYKNGKFYLDEEYTKEYNEKVTLEQLINTAAKGTNIQLDSTYKVTSDEVWLPKNSDITVIRANNDRLIDISDGSLTIGGSSDNLLILDCNIQSSTSMTAIKIDTGSTLNIKENVIIQNGYANGARAGAIYVNGGILNMYGGIIQKNKSDDAGGAILIENNGRFNMYGGTITNNYAARYGGGVRIDNGIFHQEGGTIENNIAGLGDPNISLGTNGKIE